MCDKKTEDVIAAYREMDGRLTYIWDDKEYYLGGTTHDRLTQQEQQESAQLLERLPQLTSKPDSPPPDCFLGNRAFQRAAPTNQHARNTCVCFALMAAMEGRLNRAGISMDLSEQFANWAVMDASVPAQNWCSDGLRLKDGAEILLRRGVCIEQMCPYTAKIPAEECGLGPPQAARDAASFQIGQYIVIPERNHATNENTIVDVEFLKRLIWLGFDIAISVALAFGEMRDGIHRVPRPDGVPYRPIYPNAGHAMLIVGYCVRSGVLYFECRDSLSPVGEWKHGGYMWLAADYVKQYAHYGVAVTAVRQHNSTHGSVLVPI